MLIIINSNSGPTIKHKTQQAHKYEQDCIIWIGRYYTYKYVREKQQW